MNKTCWEYYTMDTTMFHVQSELDKFMSQLGENKWELVSVDNGKAYFKRVFWKATDVPPDEGQ